MALVKIRPMLPVNNHRLLCYVHKINNVVFMQTPKPLPYYGQFNLSKEFISMCRITPMIESNKNISSKLSYPQEQLQIIDLLKTLIRCSREEADALIKKHNEFLLHNNLKLSERVKILVKNGILRTTIKDNFWILIYDKEDLTSRLKLLKKWRFTNPNNGMNILSLPFLVLMKHTQQTERELISNNGMNRITYFSSFVQCEEKKACELFMKYMFMMQIKLASFKEILMLVKANDVLTEDLLNDLWIFRYSPQFIKERAKLLDQIGAKEKCKVIKPWMLRCTESTLNRFFELREENIAALGSYTNMRDLLSNELGLSSTNVDEMIFKHPPLAKMSYSKAKDMIDFLKAEGFDSKMIYHVPRVLCHKQATLLVRMLELKKVCPNQINLQNLCKNKKDYIAFLNKISPT